MIAARWVRALLVACPLVLLAGTALAQSRGPTRINFDERLIKGQTAKAGSVYIFERKQIDIESVIVLKRRFRPKVIRTVFEADR